MYFWLIALRIIIRKKRMVIQMKLILMGGCKNLRKVICVNRFIQYVPEFQALWKSRYLAEIEEIRLEIKRLEDIANSLPVECWNTIRLEP